MIMQKAAVDCRTDALLTWLYQPQTKELEQKALNANNMESLMVAAVNSNAHGADRINSAKAAKVAAHDFKSESNTTQSVGHLAKAAVAASGDTAPNAVGKAASLIARHMLDAIPVEEAPTTELPIENGSETPPSTDSETDTTGEVEPGATTSPTEDETALLLLSDGQQAGRA